jgi:hypothetical protein
MEAKGTVKSFMNNSSGIYRKGTGILPLEGGGKRVGVKGLTGIARRLRKHSTDTEEHLWRYLRNRQIEGFKFRRQQLLPLTFTLWSIESYSTGQALSPKGKGKITFDNTFRSLRRKK